MATSKKAAPKKVAPSKSAVKAVAKKISKAAPMPKDAAGELPRDQVIAQAVDLLLQEGPAQWEPFLQKILGEQFDAGNSEDQARGVIVHGLSHYCVVVMDGSNIILEKVKAGEAASLTEIVEKQFT